jgi:hypothetical protein
MRLVRLKHKFVRVLPIYGCVSTGIIYVTIGVIAILSFLKIRPGGADESSMLAILNDYAAGKIMVLVIVLGNYLLPRVAHL